MLISPVLQTALPTAANTLTGTSLPTSASGTSIGNLSSSARRTRFIAAAVGGAVGAALLLLVLGAIFLHRRSAPGPTMSLDFFLGFGAMKSADRSNEEKIAGKRKEGETNGGSEGSDSIRSEPLPTYSEAMNEDEDKERRDKQDIPIALEEEQRW
jgi:hypothetical protein